MLSRRCLACLGPQISEGLMPIVVGPTLATFTPLLRSHEKRLLVITESVTSKPRKVPLPLTFEIKFDRSL